MLKGLPGRLAGCLQSVWTLVLVHTARLALILAPIPTEPSPGSPAITQPSLPDHQAPHFLTCKGKQL